MHADCDAIFLVRPTSYSFCLTFKCQYTAVVLVGPVQWPEESYEIWSARPSVLSFFRLDIFFKLYRHFFKFWYGARHPYEVVREEPDSPKKILENGPKMGQKQVFFIYWEIWSLIFTEFFL